MIPPADRTSNLIIWAVLVGLAVALQITALVWSRVSGLVVVLALLRYSLVIRLIVLLGWFWLGWHLFVRTDF